MQQHCHRQRQRLSIGYGLALLLSHGCILSHLLLNSMAHKKSENAHKSPQLSLAFENLNRWWGEEWNNKEKELWNKMKRTRQECSTWHVYTENVQRTTLECIAFAVRLKMLMKCATGSINDILQFSDVIAIIAVNWKTSTRMRSVTLN